MFATCQLSLFVIFNKTTDCDKIITYLGGMEIMPIEALIIGLLILGLIILFVIIRKVSTGNVKNDFKDLQVRFNAIKTVPLAFKLNKATYIAKINDELAASVEENRTKYEKTQKDIDELQVKMTALEDQLLSKKYKACKDLIAEIDVDMKEAEKEVGEVENFLDSITQREQVQREHANELKDVYREIKQEVQSRASEMTIAYDGLENKLKECENLFSSFEEQIYANEFINASEDLEKISLNLESIKKAIEEMPGLIQMAKGVIPTLMEEVENYYLKTRAKGICTNNISVELKLKEIADNVNKSTKDIMEANTAGLKDDLDSYRGQLENILDSLSKENLAYDELKRISVKIDQSLRDIEKTYYYIQKVYDTDKEKYDLKDLSEVIVDTPLELEKYRKDFDELGKALKASMTPCSVLLTRANDLYGDVGELRESLLTKKHTIDKTSNDENRANVQIVKLQIVLNEVEVKIAQYRLPAISDTYKDDLKKGHYYVKEVRSLLEEIPLNIAELNKKLDEAIDFIYKLYNNVNNVVGMAVMVENAIVFGNKYRSTYPEVDTELSKAEFSYMNGEYTQALTIAIACIEKLFPKNGDEKIVEYAKGIE